MLKKSFKNMQKLYHKLLKVISRTLIRLGWKTPRLKTVAEYADDGLIPIGDIIHGADSYAPRPPMPDSDPSIDFIKDFKSAGDTMIEIDYFAMLYGAKYPPDNHDINPRIPPSVDDES
jgi:hypothetical protein